MNTVERIEQLMKEREWTYYRLAKEAGLSNSTIANIYRRNTSPSISTLESICKALGISISQFFAQDGEQMVSLTPEQKVLFDKWSMLTERQKRLLEQMIDEFK